MHYGTYTELEKCLTNCGFVSCVAILVDGCGLILWLANHRGCRGSVHIGENAPRHSLLANEHIRQGFVIITNFKTQQLYDI